MGCRSCPSRGTLHQTKPLLRRTAAVAVTQAAGACQAAGAWQAAVLRLRLG